MNNDNKKLKFYKVFLNSTDGFEAAERYDELIVFVSATSEKEAVKELKRRLQGCDWEGGLVELEDDLDQIGMTYDDDEGVWKKGFYRNTTDEWLFTD